MSTPNHPTVFSSEAPSKGPATPKRFIATESEGILCPPAAPVFQDEPSSEPTTPVKQIAPEPSVCPGAPKAPRTHVTVFSEKSSAYRDLWSELNADGLAQ
jgi:hypothetical protein